MPTQLGRFTGPFLDRLGNVFVGASVNVYREGATVNGVQSGTSPLAVTVRNAGKIQTADTVFIDAITGTTYTATRTSETVVTLSGFAGTLVLANGQRLVPSNSPPTLYSDDQGGTTVSQPLTTDANGDVSAWVLCGVYDILLSGFGVAAARLFPGQPVVGEVTLSVDSLTSIRVVDGRAYPLTVIGVQTAIDELESVGGGWVIVPQSANIPITTTSVKVAKGVTLKSTGERSHTNATFVANSSTNVTAMIENKTQNGTQQYAGIEGIQVNGNSASGAIVGAGIKLVSVFVNSRIRDVEVYNCSGNGILIQDGGGGVAVGGIHVQNVTVTTCGDHNIVVRTSAGEADDIRFDKVESDHPAAGKAALFIDNSVGGAAGFKSQGHIITDLYMDDFANPTAIGLLLDSCQNVSVIGVNHNHTNGTPMQIKNTGGNATDCSGITVQNLYSRVAGTLIDDVAHSVTLTNSTSNVIKFYSAPTSGSNNQGIVCGIQHQKYAGTIASAASINLNGGNLDGNLYTISGVTNITSISSTTARDRGRIVGLQFSGVLTFTNGSNIRLAGGANFVTAANSCIYLACFDGANWDEVSRKA